jgi:hypothetical protein
MLPEMKGWRQLDFGPIGQQRGAAEAGEVWDENWCLEDLVSSSLPNIVGSQEAFTVPRFRQVPSSHPHERRQAEQRSN